MEDTKHCPYCDEIIKANAIKCKHCGSVLNRIPTDEIDFEVQIRLALENKFEIISEIGRGGMAIVYKAIQKNLKRTVALKIINKNLVDHKDFLERFHREAQLAASLNNPNIVTIYDEGCENGVHYISMEYLDGSDLHHLIQSKGRLGIEKTINIIAPIAEALDYAHNKGIIHRDIKSNNIILTTNGKPVLTDFGIAHAVSDTRITQTGMIIGTPNYMSPEQAMTGEVDALTDLYSLGVVLYECITGDLPFKGETPVSTIYKIINEKIEPINKTVSNAPSWLISIVNKILAKNKNDRFKSGKEFSCALKTHLGEKNYTPMSEIETVVNVKENLKRTEKKLKPKKLRKFFLLIVMPLALLIGFGYMFYNIIRFNGSNGNEMGGNWNTLNDLQKKKVEMLLKEGDILFKNDNLISPAVNNAALKYSDVLTINTGNRPSIEKLKQISERVKENIKSLMNKKNFNEAEIFSQSALKYFPNDNSFSNFTSEIKIRKLELRADSLLKNDPIEAYTVCKEIKNLDSTNNYIIPAMQQIKGQLTGYGDVEFKKGNLFTALDNYERVKSLFGKDSNIDGKIEKCNSEIKASNIIKMPNLVGLNIQKAKNIISGIGLIRGKVSEILSEKNRGIVITQMPQSGTIVKKGSSVKLIIGK